MPFEWVSEISTSTPSSPARSAARPLSRTDGAACPAADHLHLVPVAVGERQRLRDGLLDAEAGGQVAGRLAALGGERALGLGEQALGKSRPALQRLRESADLHQIDPDAGHSRRQATLARS